MSVYILHNSQVRKYSESDWTSAHSAVKKIDEASNIIWLSVRCVLWCNSWSVIKKMKTVIVQNILTLEHSQSANLRQRNRNPNANPNVSWITTRI